LLHASEIWRDRASSTGRRTTLELPAGIQQAAKVGNPHGSTTHPVNLPTSHPSFGNNFNNRTEEAMGSALCLWTAYREHAFGDSAQPFLGYLFMLEDSEKSRRPVAVKEPHFSVFPEFRDASYMRRYELFCRKLVLQRHYTAAAYLTSASQSGLEGKYATPAEDLSIERFAQLLIAHVSATL
jgi:hypothetical protein